jgi:hypothetical protein
MEKRDDSTTQARLADGGVGRSRSNEVVVVVVVVVVCGSGKAKPVDCDDDDSINGGRYCPLQRIWRRKRKCVAVGKKKNRKKMLSSLIEPISPIDSAPLPYHRLGTGPACRGRLGG